MPNGQRKPPATRKRNEEKISAIKRATSCQKPAFDRYSFGHILLGVYSASASLIISEMIIIRYGYSRELVNILAVTFTSITLAVLIGCDLLEHSTIRRKIFIGRLGDKNWCESMSNVVTDIILAFLAFIVIYMPMIYFVKDTSIILLVGFIPLFLMPLFIVNIFNAKHMKWNGFFKGAKKSDKKRNEKK